MRGWSLNWMLRDRLTEKVTFEQRPEEVEQLVIRYLRDEYSKQKKKQQQKLPGLNERERSGRGHGQRDVGEVVLFGHF